MWKGRSLAVVLPTYRERATIRAVIEGFEATGVVDEVIVVNNNAEPGTSEEVAFTSAREVLEPKQGYGAAIRRGIAEADSDLICICEADGTFEPADVWKLLAYSDDFQFAYGSRTVPDFIWDGANMGRYLRWGNWAVAKAMELLFNTVSLSDVGCTMRVVDGRAVRAMQTHFTADQGAFGPEMMLLSMIGGWRIMQVPINYRARFGQPGTTDTIAGATRVGVEMLGLLARYRLGRGRVAAAMRASGASAPEESEPRAARPGGEPSHLFPRLWRARPTRDERDRLNV
jgi:glycosyltransferase involved in cell wall biosynthesis